MAINRNTKRALIIIPILIILIVAYYTKPDNKTIIIQSVTKVWGNLTPSVRMPDYYNQFMDLNYKSVHIDDWIFLKRIRYDFGKDNRTIGFAAFSHVFFLG